MKCQISSASSSNNTMEYCRHNISIIINLEQFHINHFLVYLQAIFIERKHGEI